MNEVVIPGVDGDLTGVLLEPGSTPAANGDVPAGPPARLPAVVVLPEIDGFCEGTVAAARRLAAAGYVALALDLYAPYGSTPRLRNSEDTRAWLLRLNDRRQLSDLAMAVGGSRPTRASTRIAWARSGSPSGVATA